MEIEVKLYANLRRYRPKTAGGASHHPFSISLPDGATVALLMTYLGIPEGVVSAAGLNDEAVNVDARLQHGDRVNLFPPAAGG